jgi:hypothetical protein
MAKGTLVSRVVIDKVVYLGEAYRLDLAGVDFDDPDASGDELLSQALRKASDGGLGGAVD